MASQLEIRLQQLIQYEKDAPRCAVLRAELGCYLARIGDFERSEEIRSDLRKQFGDGRNLKVTIRLMLLEGLIHYYRDLSLDARDRIFRAKVLCSSFGESELLALTSAWLAHIDFNRSNFQSMAENIRTCIDVAMNDDGNALCRVSLVLGDAFLYSGDAKASQSWYENARIIATGLGDQAAIGAITYNRAALNVQNLRLKAIRNSLQTEEVERVQMELKTAINYQNLARLKSLDHLLRAASVGLLVVQEKYEIGSHEAAKMYESRSVPEDSGEYLILIADLVNCHSALGDLDSARKFLSEIDEDKFSRLDEDDLAVAFASLSLAAMRFGEDDMAVNYRNRCLHALSKHDAAMLAINELLAEFRSRTDLSI